MRPWFNPLLRSGAHPVLGRSKLQHFAWSGLPRLEGSPARMLLRAFNWGHYLLFRSFWNALVSLFNMRTLLRHTGTGLFFQGPDKWTSTPEVAFDFRFIDRAVNFAETWELKDVELAFAFEDPQWMTTVSLERTSLRYGIIATPVTA